MEFQEVHYDELKKKKILAIMVMLVIMILTLLLLVTTFTWQIWGSHINGFNSQLNIDTDGDGICDLNCDTDNDGKCDKHCTDVDAFVTIVNDNNLNLEVTARDMMYASFGNEDSIEIRSETINPKFMLKSNLGITRCTYNIKYKTITNTFENRYVNGALDRQLLLEIKSYNIPNAKYFYNIDLVNIKNQSEYLVGTATIENDEKLISTTVQEWEVTLKFLNYKNYNQNNNAGKKAVGTLIFELDGCSRVDKD